MEFKHNIVNAAIEVQEAYKVYDVSTKVYQEAEAKYNAAKDIYESAVEECNKAETDDRTEATIDQEIVNDYYSTLDNYEFALDEYNEASIAFTCAIEVLENTIEQHKNIDNFKKKGGAITK